MNDVAISRTRESHRNVALGERKGERKREREMEWVDRRVCDQVSGCLSEGHQRKCDHIKVQNYLIYRTHR